MTLAVVAVVLLHTAEELKAAAAAHKAPVASTLSAAGADTQESPLAAPTKALSIRMATAVPSVGEAAALKVLLAQVARRYSGEPGQPEEAEGRLLGSPVRG